MPIVIDRKTGKILSAPQLTPDQKQAAWESIVKAYVEKHPEKLQIDYNTEEMNKGPE